MQPEYTQFVNKSNKSEGSVAEAVDLLLERHVIPFATFEVRDELLTTAHYLLATTY